MKRAAQKSKVQDPPQSAETPVRSKTLTEQVRSNIERVQQAFYADPLFRDDPQDVDTSTAVAAWAMLKTLVETLSERQERYRQELLKRTQEQGAETPKGNQRLWLDDCEVMREKRQEKLPAEVDFRNLLALKNIPFSEAFDEVKYLKMNPSKIEYLVQTGKLQAAEVEELRKISWALKVNKSELLEKVLDDSMNVLLGNPIGTKRLKSG